MKIKILFLVILVLQPNIGLSDPCQGKGTVFFYGNGMFNLDDDAEKSQSRLIDEIKKNVSLDQGKDINDDLAYKTSEPLLTQFKNVFVQKKIENFETFWLWVSSLKDPPSWFQEKIKQTVAEQLKERFVEFEDVPRHFEDYSDYIREGYNIVLVSHSQGNLYANQAMKKLESYTDTSLTGSLADKRSKNPLFPQFFSIFANVQVATPVLATMNLSPWSTFRDDIIMNIARTFGGTLPPNLKTLGIGLPPEGDLFGHNFIKAYLRNDESRGKILSDIQTQYNKLKYPIGYFQKAFLIESHWRHFGEGNHLNSPDADFYFKVVDTVNREVGGHDEVRPNKNEIVNQAFANCYELPLGISKIYLSVASEEKREVSFEVWPEGKKEGVKPQIVSFPVKRGNSDWEVGTIQTEKGSGKEPLQVKVEICPQPKPRSKKDMSL